MAAVEITPDTHVKMTVTKSLAIVGGIIGVVFAAAASWFGVSMLIQNLGKDMAAHVANREVHIDPGYQFEHGRPVGKWDLNVYQSETNQALKEMRESIDLLRTALVNQPAHRR